MATRPFGKSSDPARYQRLFQWWMDDPTDPDRPLLSNHDVQQLIHAIRPGAQATDLGGTMSLNVQLEDAEFVLRVYQPFVSRGRILAVQHVRHCLADLGLIVPVPVCWRNATIVRCGSRWAELETYLPHTRAKPEYDSYRWLFGAMGTLHRTLAGLNMTVPRPLIATYAPPRTLLRWLPVTESAVRHDHRCEDTIRLLHRLIRRLHTLWQPATLLPQQLIHGDVRLSNVCQSEQGETVYLDFGFLAVRPRVHDLAYALAFMLLALGGGQDLASFPWSFVPECIDAYETAASTCLTAEERRALVPYTAAVPLYFAALAGFSHEPVRLLRDRLPFLRVSEWLLIHPHLW